MKSHDTILLLALLSGPLVNLDPHHARNSAVIQSKAEPDNVIEPPLPPPVYELHLPFPVGRTNCVLESTTNLTEGDFAGRHLSFPIWNNREDWCYVATNFVTNADSSITTNPVIQLKGPHPAQEFYRIVGEIIQQP